MKQASHRSARMTGGMFHITGIGCDADEQGQFIARLAYPMNFGERIEHDDLGGPEAGSGPGGFTDRYRYGPHGLPARERAAGPGMIVTLASLKKGGDMANTTNDSGCKEWISRSSRQRTRTPATEVKR
jgi:hypothetical protein